uniref:Uncharacterized protein n=1 Tax=Photinus pyralis TaxID=7054 RepID=A0A1Y1M6M9_PHOPY
MVLASKSKSTAYYKEYGKLLAWMNMKHLSYKVINALLMLANIKELLKIFKSSTLWCTHSKHQSMLQLKSGADLTAYPKSKEKSWRKLKEPNNRKRDFTEFE